MRTAFLVALVLLPLGHQIRFSNRTEEPATSASASLVDVLPADCLATVDASGLEDLFSRGLGDPFVTSLLETELGHYWTNAATATPTQALTTVEDWLGTEPLATLHDLVGTGLVFGWYGEVRKGVVVGRGREAKATSDALGAILSAVGRSSGFPGAFEKPHDHWGSARVWHVDELWLVSLESLWILGQSEDLVRGCLARSLERPLERPAQAKNQEELHRLELRIDLEGLAKETADGILDLQRGAGTPAFHFLLGSGLAALADARVVSITVDLRPGRVSLVARAEGASRPHDPHDIRERETVPPALTRPDDLGSALIHRDLATLVSRRVELFPPTSLPAFAESLGVAALLFGGRDVEREVLPALSSWWRVIARQPDFDPLRTPVVELPGLALVVPVESLEAGEDWIVAFQTMISFVNVEEAQKGHPGLRLHLEQQGDVTITSAHRPALREGEGADVRYNIEPAAATTQGLVILSTHVSILRDVLRRLSESPSIVETNPLETAEVDARAVARIVDHNRSLLEQRKQLEEGGSIETARAEVEILRSLLASMGSVRLSVATAEETELRLDLDWSASTEEGR